jgi:hypothetical protein
LLWMSHNNGRCKTTWTDAHKLSWRTSAAIPSTSDATIRRTVLVVVLNNRFKYMLNCSIVFTSGFLICEGKMHVVVLLILFNLLVAWMNFKNYFKFISKLPGGFLCWFCLFFVFSAVSRRDLLGLRVRLSPEAFWDSGGVGEVETNHE